MKQLITAGYQAISPPNSAIYQPRDWKQRDITRKVFGQILDQQKNRQSSSFPPKTKMEPEKSLLENEKHPQTTNFQVPC